MSVSTLFTETPFHEAVTGTVVVVVTGDAVALKVAETLPAAMLTEAGMASSALVSDKAITAPPAGAACDRLTVHVAVPEETIEDGLHVRDFRVGPVGIVTAIADP